MTVGQLGDAMSADEFTHWGAFFELEKRDATKAGGGQKGEALDCAMDD